MTRSSRCVVVGVLAEPLVTATMPLLSKSDLVPEESVKNKMRLIKNAIPLLIAPTLSAVKNKKDVEMVTEHLRVGTLEGGAARTPAY